MSKKKLSFLTVLIMIMTAGALNLHAIRLLTVEDAITNCFGEGAKVTLDTKTLAGPKLARIKERLGGALFHHHEGAKQDDSLKDKNTVDIYLASSGGKTIGYAVHDIQPGKWGPIEFLVALEPNGSISKVLVLSYEEKRGRPIARSSFLTQFVGKTLKDKILLREDIVGITGATISSTASTFTVRKALVLFDELYKN